MLRRQEYPEPATKFRGEGRFVRRSGGPGMYGHCVIEVEPQERGVGFTFRSALVGGAIPAEFMRPIEEGIRDAMARGVLAGYPVVDVAVTLVDGSYHPVDSNAQAFRLAAGLAFRDACAKSEMGLLEPVADIEIVAPAECIGDVLGDLMKRRGQVMRQETQTGGTDVTLGGRVPMAETFGYATDLRSLTQGRATFTLTPSGYEFAPETVAREIIARRAVKTG
jgi:elongation factor G